MQRADIVKNKVLRAKARALYMEAFPKAERIPWWLLTLNSCRRHVDLTAWVEEDTFCGMTASVTEGNDHFLLFFAVEQSLRGQGYGSKILTQLRNAYDSVALNVELLDPTAENFLQRQRRFAFYGRNGFVDTGYHVWEIGGKFRVLSTRKQLNVPVYKKFFKKLTFGLWNVRLEKEK